MCVCYQTSGAWLQLEAGPQGRAACEQLHQSSPRTSSGADSSDSLVLPASSWRRSGKQVRTSPKTMACVPPRQLCGDVSKKSWNHRSLLTLLSIPPLVQKGQAWEVLLASGPTAQDTERGAGWQQTKTKRLMAQKDGGKVGS